MVKRKTKYPFPGSTAKADDQPASGKMLKLVKNELKEEIGLVRSELKGEISHVRTSMQGSINSLDTRLSHVEVELKDLKGEVREVKKIVHQNSRNISEIKIMVHKTNLLVEEQNANSQIVLDGLQAVWQRQDRMEGLC